MRSTAWGLSVVGLVLVAWWGLVRYYDRDRATLTVLDRNGQVIGTLNAMAGGRQIWTPLDQIPETVITKTLTVEDRFFKYHIGVNPIATLKAAGSNLRHGSILRGGSTITQQLAKLLIQEKSGQRSARTLLNKLHEAIVAIGLEAFHGKEWILERYLNMAYYGEHCYGIAAAARHYYGRPLSQLHNNEISQLVRLPKSPNRYAAAIQGRDPMHSDVGRHFMNTLVQSMPPMTRVVTTTLDLALQKQLETMIRHLLAPHLQEDPKVTAAAVVIHVPTGDLRAMVGSRDYFDASIDGQFNAATALRQPGSALKPFTYFAAFAKGLTPETLVSDEPTSFYAADSPEAAGYIPHNFDRRYHGEVTIRQALANSYNVPAVVVLNRIGIGPYQEILRKLGLSSLSQSPYYYGLSLTLGSGEVSLLELTNAYAALARGGQFLPYRMQLSVPIPKATPVVANAEQFSRQITDILSDERARLKSFGYNPNLDVEDHRVAVKTGTSYDHRDNWTVGYTSDYAIGIWVGHADNTPLLGTTGASGAAPLWHAAMEYVVRGKPAIADDVSSPVQKRDEPLAAEDRRWRLISPLGNSVYRTNVFAPHQYQQIEAAVRVRRGHPATGDALRLHWHLDGSFLATTTTDHPRLWLNPTPGPHELQVMDETGHEEHVNFQIEEGT